MEIVHEIRETRELSYRFSELELKELGEQLSEQLSDYFAKEAEKKQVTKHYNSVLKNMMEEVKETTEKLNTGMETREVSCLVEHHSPVYGRMKITRMDTGDYWDEPMDLDLFNAPMGRNIDVLWEEE